MQIIPSNISKYNDSMNTKGKIFIRPHPLTDENNNEQEALMEVVGEEEQIVAEEYNEEQQE